MIRDLKPALFVDILLDLIYKLDEVIDNIFSEENFHFLEVERSTVE